MMLLNGRLSQALFYLYLFCKITKYNLVKANNCLIYTKTKGYIYTKLTLTKACCLKYYQDKLNII
jgi:hypothetical protein